MVRCNAPDFDVFDGTVSLDDVLAGDAEEAKPVQDRLFEAANCREAVFFMSAFSSRRNECLD